MTEPKNIKNEITDFCETLKRKGILTPAMERRGMGITNFLLALADIESTFEFAEANDEGKKERQTLLEFMREFLIEQPPSIIIQEVLTKEKTGPGYNDDKREWLITQYQKQHKSVDYETAALAVAREHPEIFVQDY